METGRNATVDVRGATLTARRRRRVQRAAQSRSRRRVALFLAALVLASAAVLAAGALRAGAATPPGAATPSGAGALLSSLAGVGVGDIFDDPSVGADDATVCGARKSADLSFTDGFATVRSSLIGVALSCESDVSVSDVSLLGGVVTADSVELVATADAGPSTADAGADGTYVSGLKINGRPVAAGPGDISIPGVGTLTVLSQAVDQSWPAPSAVVGGLELTLDQPVDGLAAGSVIVVGRATAAADSAAAAALVALAAKQLGPTPLPAPLPTPTAAAKSHHGAAAGGNSSSSGGKSSSSGGNSSSSAAARRAQAATRTPAAASPTARWRRRRRPPRRSSRAFRAPCSLSGAP